MSTEPKQADAPDLSQATIDYKAMVGVMDAAHDAIDKTAALCKDQSSLASMVRTGSLLVGAVATLAVGPVALGVAVVAGIAATVHEYKMDTMLREKDNMHNKVNDGFTNKGALKEMQSSIDKGQIATKAYKSLTSGPS